KQRAQVGILIACLVVGLVIVVSIVTGTRAGSGRRIVVDANARPASKPATTRVAATRPMKAQFVQALWARKRDKAIALLKEDPKLATVEVEEDGFSTPLHVVAFQGDVEFADALLDAGADIEAVEISHNATPLEWAAYGAE